MSALARLGLLLALVLGLLFLSLRLLGLRLLGLRLFGLRLLGLCRLGRSLLHANLFRANFLTADVMSQTLGPLSALGLELCVLTILDLLIRFPFQHSSLGEVD